MDKIEKLKEIKSLQDQGIINQQEADHLKSEVMSGNIYSYSLGKISQFKTVKIGNQIWMAENLNVDKFRNGDPIPQVKWDFNWQKYGSESKPAWCYYDNYKKDGIILGKLYNFHAVISARELEPVGWHIATTKEWETLFSYLGGIHDASSKLKNVSGWKRFIDKDIPTNSSGFNALPGGWRRYDSKFFGMNESARWWTYDNDMNPFIISIYYYQNMIEINSEYDRRIGLYVRFIKD